MNFQEESSPFAKWGRKSMVTFSDIDENASQENPAINQFVNNNR